MEYLCPCPFCYPLDLCKYGWTWVEIEIQWEGVGGVEFPYVSLKISPPCSDLFSGHYFFTRKVVVYIIIKHI